LGVLRARGAIGGQLRGLLHWQATTVAAVVLALGVPIGLLGGRVVFAAIADRVGIAPEPRIAWILIPVLAAAVVVMTNVAALVPGIRAGRASTVDLVAEP
jgi:predicted lysophospholipase L1 biosynthesis ABC-type transport system permease subunit